jgi:glycosyltransferase involved in cell wall biosynthesis
MTTPAPQVSVIICVRNGATTLRTQLESLGRQIDAPPFEVVIVDNGSADATAAVAYAWIDDGIGTAADAYIVDASDRPGLAFARNVGAASSRSDVLAYCDADDAVGEGWVKAASSVAGGPWQVLTGPIRELRQDGTPGVVLMHGIDHVRQDAGAATSLPFFRGCNFALTRAAFEAMGGFDAGFPPYGADDSEAGVRLADAGIEIGFHEDMVVAYRQAKGWRQRLQRQYRAGAGQAVQWARHPEFYRRRPSSAVLVRSVVGSPLRVLFQGGSRLRTRVLRAAEECALWIGAVSGTRMLRAGRYANAEYYDATRDRRKRRIERSAPQLALVTPVRHPHNSQNYDEVEKALRASVTAWLRQTDPDVVVIVVANRKPDLPDDPRITMLTVDFPPPSAARTSRTGNAAVLRDKGSKNAVGLAVAHQLGAQYIMFADADDFISRRLTAFVRAHSGQPGWTVTDGWRLSVQRRAIRRHRADFHLQCGTSHIIRSDLLPSTTLSADATQDELYAEYGPLLERWFGSHMYLHEDLPLEPLPFPGALYQVGTVNSQSGNALGGQGWPVTRLIADEFGVLATSLTPRGLARAMLPTRRAIAERLRRVRRRILGRLRGGDSRGRMATGSADASWGAGRRRAQDSVRSGDAPASPTLRG